MEKGDFVKVEYTGKVSETGAIFDTTDKALAEKEGMYNPRMPYGPVTICLGEGHVLAGLENELVSKELGKEYTIKIGAQDAFGKKNAKLLKIVPLSTFKKHKITPQPGLQVNIDGEIGYVRSATGGRIVVDFNHPLAGRDVEYVVRVIESVADASLKVRAIMTLELHLSDVQVSVTDLKGVITTRHELPEQIQVYVIQRVKDLVGLETVEFAVQPPEKA